MKVFDFILRGLLTATIGILSAAVFLPMAYADRGYFGFGGEWILIISAIAIAWHYTAKIVKGDETDG